VKFFDEAFSENVEIKMAASNPGSKFHSFGHQNCYFGQQLRYFFGQQKLLFLGSKF
jgi:hypothetical protein